MLLPTTKNLLEMNKESWEVKKLSQIGTIVTGNTPKTSIVENYESDDICFVKPGDIIADGISLIKSTDNYISEYARTQARVLPKGSILATCIGIVGKIAILEKEAATNQQINSIIPKKDTNSKFISYALYGARNTFNHIANAPVVPIINKTQFSSIEIPIPLLTIQNQIVAELDELNNILDKKRKQLEELDTLAQATFYDMFGDPVENEKGWKMKAIGEISTIGTGATPSRQRESLYYGGMIPWVKTTEVKGVDIVETEEYITELALNDTNCKIYPINTILLAMYGQGKTRGQVGILKTEATTNQACAAIITNTSIDYEYLYQFLKLNYEYIRSFSRGGNQENLNLSLVRAIPVILPPLTLQKQFAERIEAIEKQKELINKSIVDVQLLFDYTMDKYFN